MIVSLGVRTQFLWWWRWICWTGKWRPQNNITWKMQDLQENDGPNLGAGKWKSESLSCIYACSSLAIWSVIFLALLSVVRSLQLSVGHSAASFAISLDLSLHAALVHVGLFLYFPIFIKYCFQLSLEWNEPCRSIISQSQVPDISIVKMKAGPFLKAYLLIPVVFLNL